jgi:hypothetical protein
MRVLIKIILKIYLIWLILFENSIISFKKIVCKYLKINKLLVIN